MIHYCLKMKMEIDGRHAYLGVGLLLTLSTHLTKAEPCRPVNLQIQITDFKREDYGNISIAVLDIAKNLTPYSNMSVSIANIPIFMGLMPADVPRLHQALKQYKLELQAKRSIDGTEFSQYLQHGCNGNCSGAQLTVLIVHGKLGRGQQHWSRDVITTVVQLDPTGDYSEQWQTITADDDHYLVVGIEGGIPVPNVTSLICKDSSRLCGTTQYMDTDRETIDCKSCNSYCSSGYMKPHCKKICPYYKEPVVPKPTVISNPTSVNDSLTAGQTVAIVIGVLAGSAIIGGVIDCVLRVVRKRKRRRQKGLSFFSDTVNSSPKQEYHSVPTSESTSAGEQPTGSSTVGGQATGLSTAEDQTAASSTAEDQSTGSSTDGDQPTASSTAGDQPTGSSTDGNLPTGPSTAGDQPTGCCSSGNQLPDAVLFVEEIELNDYALNGPMSTVHVSE